MDYSAFENDDIVFHKNRPVIFWLIFPRGSYIDNKVLCVSANHAAYMHDKL